MNDAHLAAALGYVTRGLPVFPLEPRGKRPLTGHGLHDATTDEASVRGWWGDAPDANIGLRTDGFLVVDLDVKRGEDGRSGLERWDALSAARGGHEPTRTQETGSGGRQLFFLDHERRFRNSAGRLGAGIDTRGVGGYVVLPPSLHPCGARYRWLSERPCIPVPDWLALLLTRPPAPPLGEQRHLPPGLTGTPYGEKALLGLVDEMRRTPEGGRNQTLVAIGYRAGRLVAAGELDALATEDALLNAATAAGLPEREARTTFRNGYEAGRRAGPAARGPHLTHGSALITTNNDATTTSAQRVDKRMRVVLVDPAEISMEPVEFLDDAYRIPLGMSTLLAGDGGLGKSLYAIRLAATVTQGGGGVIFASAEDDRAKTWLPRLVAAGADLACVRLIRLRHDEVELAWDETISIPGDLLELQEAVRAFEATLLGSRVKLVVIDPLEAHLGDERDDGNSSTRRRQALGPLEALANRLDVAVLLVHHINKDASQRASHRVLGTIANRNAPRSMLLFGTNPDEQLPEGASEGSERVLYHDKHNVSPRSPTQLYRVVPVDIVGDDGARIATAKLEYVRDVELDPETIFGRSARESDEVTVLDEARQFLVAELADGPRLVSEVNRDARGLGITERTLERARKVLGVESFRVGGAGDRGRWSLRLPLEGRPPSTSRSSLESRAAKAANPSAQQEVGGLNESRYPCEFAPDSRAKAASDTPPGGLGGLSSRTGSDEGSADVVGAHRTERSSGKCLVCDAVFAPNRNGASLLRCAECIAGRSETAALAEQER